MRDPARRAAIKEAASNLVSCVAFQNGVGRTGGGTIANVLGHVPPIVTPSIRAAIHSGCQPASSLLLEHGTELVAELRRVLVSVFFNRVPDCQLQDFVLGSGNRDGAAALSRKLPAIDDLAFCI